MSLTPTVVETEVSTYPHGNLATLTESELKKSAAVRTVGEKAEKAETEFRLAVIALKLEMDANDPAVERTGGQGTESRFWKSAREGQHGPYLQEMIENGNRMTVQRWLKYEKAATELLETGVTRVTPNAEPSSQLATVEALDRGLSFRALESFAILSDDAKDTARKMLNTHQKVSQHDIEQIHKVHRNYPDLVPTLRQGIESGEITRQKDIDTLMQEEDKARAVEAARIKREAEEAAKLANVEKEEEELANKRDESAPAATEKPASSITQRKALPRHYYESDKGKLEVARVVGDLPNLIPSLGSSLNKLEKELANQFDRYGEMHHYREFMAGYDAYFYSETAAARKWGTEGRLARLKKIQSQLNYLSQQVTNYIDISTPDPGTIYPD